MSLVRTAMLIAAMTALFLAAGFAIGGVGGALIAFVAALAMNGYAWWNSDQLALRAHGAQPLSRASAPQLFEDTERMARSAGMPTPALYLLPSSQPNAFATGRSPDASAVAVTEGLLRELSREEVAAVVAHELAHIQNRDTLIMTIAATFAGAITMLAQFGWFYGGHVGRGERAGPATAVFALIAVFLAPMAAALVQMSISRTREYAADRLGAEICGQPLWLASALGRLAGGARRREMASAEARPGSAHLFIVTPLSGRTFDGLFATHPPIARRIAALEEMAREPGFAQGGPLRSARSDEGGSASAGGPWGGGSPSRRRRGAERGSTPIVRRRRR